MFYTFNSALKHWIEQAHMLQCKAGCHDTVALQLPHVRVTNLLEMQHPLKHAPTRVAHSKTPERGDRV